jgi:hypothetical protein
MDTNVILGEPQNLLSRVGLDDKLTACLVLACGVSLVIHTVNRHKKVAVYTEPWGTTRLQKEGLL